MPKKLDALDYSNLSKEDITWAAGFFEGEGSCGKYFGESYPNGILTAKIAQVNEEPLSKLHKLFGGNKYHWVRRKDKRGYFQWQINSAQAFQFMNTILPYLSAKRQDQFVQALKKKRI